MLPFLTAENGYIFRITHRNNIPWILDNGIHCASSSAKDPNFVSIGNADLIDKRFTHYVPKKPGGTLSDYVPFYFTPRSMMALNIKTGWNGVQQRDSNEIVILTTKLRNLEGNDVRFLFTDRHAFVAGANYYSDLENLENIDWNILQNSDFKRDLDDIGKTSRYQAEALVHRHLPTHYIDAIVCYDGEQKSWVDEELNKRNLEIKTARKGGWYF